MEKAVINNKRLTICFLGEAKKEDVFALRWAKYFAEKGHDVRLISYSQPDWSDDELGKMKIYVLEKKFPEMKSWLFNAVFNFPLIMLRVRKLIREINPDILHAQCVTSYGTIGAFTGFHPFLLTAYGSDILINPLKNKLIGIATRYVLKKADLITCDAQHVKDAMIKFGVKPERVRIINFGIDAKQFSPKSKNKQLKADLGIKNEMVVMSLRKLEPIYDIMTLVESIPLVLRKVPETKFIIVGSGSEEKGLKERAKELKIEERVKFVGWVKNDTISNHLSVADVYVSTALSDAGIASSTAEAMACGVPAVVTDIGENRKWIQNGKSGFVVPIKEPAMLAEKIIYLLKNKNKREEFGRRGREIVEKKNSYRNEMLKMEKIYNEFAIHGKYIEYQICKKCIMDTSDPDIFFDKKGICNHCARYEKVSNSVLSKNNLESIIEKIKKSGQGKKYDCIIGLSGGVDSSMVAYVVKQHGLRPLAIHVDNGWNSELSVANIEKIVKNLKIDFRTYVIDWEEFKDLQLAFLKSSESNIEIPTDHAIVAALYKTAIEFNVKYILHGGNLKTEAIMPFAWGYDAKDLKHLRAIHTLFGRKRLKTFPTLSIWSIFYYTLIKKIRYIGILNYIEYEKDKAKVILRNELGWREYGKKHEESIFTRFFQNYILPKKFGIDKRRAHFSTLINSGQMTKEDALGEMGKPLYESANIENEEKEYVIKKLDLTSKKFEEIMMSPPKSYKSYPNDDVFIKKLVFLYVFIKKLLIK